MVEVKSVSLTYQEKEEVLQNLSLSVNEGECILLTGRSGSGKSSVINSINGLAARYDGATIEGEVVVSGRDVRALELYEISMLVSSVFQNPKTHFFNVNTTMELLFYLENIGLSREKMEERLRDTLAVFPIAHLLGRDIFQLSGGEKQILCIAASYIAGTGVIVLDEPSSNLDEENIAVLSEMLQRLKSKGITLIICEHRLYYLMDVADRVFLLQDGVIKGEYAVEDFKRLGQKELNGLGLRDTKRTKLDVPPVGGEGNLNIKKMVFAFPGAGSRLQIKDVRFSTGTIVGIVGANGFGKSTFVRCLIGVEKKSDDEIYLDGKKLSKKERLKMSSLVMQDVNHQLFTDSVTDEIGLGIKNAEKSKVEDVLKSLDLFDMKDRHPMSLSGGQKQRVAVASVVYKNSKLVFFDEPTSGMDYANMMKISNLIKSCKRPDNIIFIISHDMEFLNETADCVMDITQFHEPHQGTA